LRCFILASFSLYGVVQGYQNMNRFNLAVDFIQYTFATSLSSVGRITA
jgi:hypothetical protein